MLNKIVFDVSGVLWNDRRQVFEAISNVLKENGLTHFPEVFGEYSRQRLSVDGLIANGKGSCVEMFRSCGIDPNLSDDQLNKMYKEQLSSTVEQFPAELYSGVNQMLEVAQQKCETLYIVSDHPENILQTDLDRLDIRKYFEKIIVGEVHNKVDYLLKIRKDSNSVFGYIGDTQSDMKAAQNARMIPIGASWGYEEKDELIQAGAVSIYDSPKHFKDSISNLYAIKK